VGFAQSSPGERVATVLGVFTLGVVLFLFVQDAAPRRFPAGSHAFLAAFSLAAIAMAYLIFQLARRNAFMEVVKAVLLAAAFLFWAANQFWPRLPQAGLFNDIAIGLFVLDVFFVIARWPAAASRSVFTESDAAEACRCICGCRSDKCS
jgi:hypothetical protein